MIKLQSSMSKHIPVSSAGLIVCHFVSISVFSVLLCVGYRLFAFTLCCFFLSLSVKSRPLLHSETIDPRRDACVNQNSGEWALEQSA